MTRIKQSLALFILPLLLGLSLTASAQVKPIIWLNYSYDALNGQFAISAKPPADLSMYQKQYTVQFWISKADNRIHVGQNNKAKDNQIANLIQLKAIQSNSNGSFSYTSPKLQKLGFEKAEAGDLLIMDFYDMAGRRFSVEVIELK